MSSADTSESSSGESSTTWDARTLDWIGRVLDERYEIEDVLAEGGMGALFAARHVKLGRKVVVKMIHPEHAENAEVAERFSREVEANARLEHPHVVAALDCGTTAAGEAYLVMQHARGRTLADAVRAEGALDWRVAATIAAEIADALAAAHAAGVVHRDIKPDNVLLVHSDGDGERAMLLDFGVARLVEPGEESVPASPALTQKGTAVGTVGYMAPEQALGQDVDGRADLYCLGLLLWEMLTGEPRFDTRELTLGSFAARQISDGGRSPSELVPDLPADLAALVGELLVFERDARPSGAREVRARLRALAVLPAPEPPVESSAGGLREKVAPMLSRAGVILRSGWARSRAGTRTLLEWIYQLPPPRILATGVGLGALLALATVGVGSLFFGAEESGSEEFESEEFESEEPSDIDSYAALLGRRTPRAERRAAARAILDSEEDEDSLFLNLARLEVLTACRPRQEAVRDLGELGDERALEPLRRYQRDRCGRRFRQALDRATRRIRAAR